MELTIRPERAEDHAAIAEVVTQAFGSPAEAGLVEAIRASPEYVPELSLVALLDGHVVGHVMISGALLVGDGGPRPIAMLSPLAVEPSRQRHGIGAALVRAVTEAAETRGADLVILEGDPAYYGRFGFEPASPLGIDIHLPSWAPAEAAQVLRLATYDRSVRGRVVYPPAFDPFADE